MSQNRLFKCYIYVDDIKFIYFKLYRGIFSITCYPEGVLTTAELIKTTEQKPEDITDYYEKYYRAVLKHAAYLTGNIPAAEDIAQETFIRLHKNFPPHSNICAWLMKTATNLSYNYIRGNKLKRSKECVIAESEAGNVISIEDAAIRDLEIRAIRKALQRLKPRDRLCLLLKYSGYKYCEISAAAGIDINSVGKILARAQAKLKDLYLKEAGVNEMS